MINLGKDIPKLLVVSRVSPSNKTERTSNTKEQMKEEDREVQAECTARNMEYLLGMKGLNPISVHLKDVLCTDDFPLFGNITQCGSGRKADAKKKFR